MVNGSSNRNGRGEEVQPPKFVRSKPSPDSDYGFQLLNSDGDRDRDELEMAIKSLMAMMIADDEAVWEMGEMGLRFQQTEYGIVIDLIDPSLVDTDPDSIPTHSQIHYQMSISTRISVLIREAGLQVIR